MEYSKDYWIGYVSGFADGEGYVGSKEITISNTVKQLLDHCQQGLTTLGIHSSLLGPYSNGRPYKPIYRLRIQRKADVIRFAELISFRDTQKRDKTARIVAKYNSTEKDKLGRVMDKYDSQLRKH